MKKSLLIISFLLSLSVSAQIFVNASATGANDGSSWTDAYTDLQTALANDTNGDNIWIAAGTYTPGNSITSLFNLDQPNVTLYGGFNGTENLLSERDTAINVTILSGDLNANDTGVEYSSNGRDENAARILVINQPGCTIDGITISGGHAVGTNGSSEEGSAIYANDANVTIKNCIVKENVVSRGGVIRVIDKFGTTNIENTIISDNLGNFAPVLYSRASGGTLNINFINCLISGNRKDGGASTNPGLVWFRQDLNRTINGKLINCTIVNNTSTNAGSSVAVSGTQANGGSANVEILNSIFQGNEAINGATTSIMNSVGNGTNSGSASLYAIRNSLDETSFSNITNNGSNRINTNTSSANPMFTSTTDFTLTSGSAAVDAGDNALLPSNIVVDLIGNARVSGAAVDMGAYEFGSAPLGPIYVDASATGNNDGSSWTDAYQDLTTALSINQNGREYWIAAGTYTPGTARTNAFALNNDETILYGGFDGSETMLTERDVVANPTVLSGDLNGNDGQFTLYNSADRNDNSLNILNVFAQNCTLDGLTISSGQANDNSSNATQEGSAIKLQTGNFTINQCIIEKNAALRGGVIEVIDKSGTLTISNTIMRENLGRFAPLLYARAANADLTINLDNCLFVNNEKVGIGATDSIGFFWFRQDISGGNALRAKFTNCTFANNTANISSSNTTVISASRSTGNGAICQLRVFNSIFNGNDNITTGNTDLISVGNGTSQTAANIYEISNSMDETGFSNIGNNGSTRINSNNLSATPIFTSTTDFSLQSNSPAIDAGNNQFVIYSEDLLGNSRVVNNVVDMGAIEFNGTASIEEVNLLSIKLHPNPVTDVLNVEIGYSAFAKAEIYNLQGQQVAISKEPTIQVADLRAGMYLIKVVTKDGATATQQFIKK